MTATGFTIQEFEIQLPLIPGSTWKIFAVARYGKRRRVYVMETLQPEEVFANMREWLENNPTKALTDLYALPREEFAAVMANAVEEADLPF